MSKFAVAIFCAVLSIAMLESRLTLAQEAFNSLQLRDRTVYINVYNHMDPIPSNRTAQGSGVILKGGFVISALHLLRDPDTRKIPDDPKVANVVGHIGGPEATLGYALHFVAKDDDNDIVLFRFDPSVGLNFPFVCYSMTEVKQEDSIRTIGYPLGKSAHYNSGKINNVGPVLLSVDASATAGSSGAPVFSDSGRLIGIMLGEFKAPAGQSDIYSVMPVTAIPQIIGRSAQPLADECQSQFQSEARVARSDITNDKNVSHFVEDFVNNVYLDSDVLLMKERIRGNFADKVRYYGKFQNIDFVLNDKVKYFDRFSTASYKQIPGSLVLNKNDDGTFEAKFVTSYRLVRKKDGAVLTGFANVNLTLAPDGSSFKIIGENSKAVKLQ